MLFNSLVFFVFLGIVLPIFYGIGRSKGRAFWLLFCSYFFYSYWDWRFSGLLMFSTLIDFWVGKRLYKAKGEKYKKRWLLLSLGSNLGVLAFFKYFNFFTDSFQQLFSGLGFQVDFLHLSILLPIGISFYTFQTLSYTIDIYRGRLKPTKSLLEFALFVSFFPQLVAGPIERATHLLPQLKKLGLPNKTQVEKGIVLIVIGLFKKVMIGDTAGRYVDHIFNDLAAYPSIEVLSALLLFAVQIYADFSGYSHIARGVAKLLGIELMKNFEQPYFSQNITEFWRRWHISLSTWLRDYLYISLGGNREGQARTYMNLGITMLLGGLWHGASWNFVIWGGLHGVYLMIHKVLLGNSKLTNQPYHFRWATFPSYLLKVLGTFSLVSFTWLFFRASTLEQTMGFFHKMIHWEASSFAFQYMGIVLTFLYSYHLFSLF